MLFNSFSFAIFFPIVSFIYWALPQKFRWILILISSYYFYMSWNVKYVFLIFFTTFISYAAGILLENTKKVKLKKLILAGTSVACLGVLFFFKYFNFVTESLSRLLRLISIEMDPFVLKLLLPVGISFYTFQTLSYVIDVYKGDIKAEHHFGYYAAFISFFPQLVAGPIERTHNLLPQIKGEHKFDYNQATYGLKLMAWGFFKKIVIADTLSNYVSTVYNAPTSFAGFSLIIATVFFSFQIYCDFSGYSDIAIGSAKLLGIELMTNFKSPYFSQSIKEFWSRWHISLSTWFRDYIYIPLGGNRVGKIRQSANLFVTFLISGLWHGASWTYVIWGGIHGLGQIFEKILIPKQLINKKSKGIIWFTRVVLVFIFTSFAWIFFVSNSMTDAIYVIKHLFVGLSSPVKYLHDGFSMIGISKIDLFYLCLQILVLLLFDYTSLRFDIIKQIGSQKGIVRWIIYLFFTFWILLNVTVKGQSEFIYFQF